MHDETRLVRSSAVEDQPHIDASPPDRIGLVYPTYAWGPPALVQQFASKRLTVGSDTTIFAVVTCALCSGAAVAVLERLLKKRGRSLAAAYQVKMPENYPPRGGPPATGKQLRILERADHKLSTVIAALNRPRPFGMEQPNVLFRALGTLVNPMFKHGLKRSDRKFYADNRCDGCGECARICPTANIEVNAERPAWLGHCEQCFASLHWCPREAIQYGRKSRRQPRYHHPGTSLQDFVQHRSE